MIERREGEDVTESTIRRIRAEILEQAAARLEREAEESLHPFFRAGVLASAHHLRKMAEE